jgi:ubiquinone/menaquinone biosynthesis C-methylase UbiE
MHNNPGGDKPPFWARLLFRFLRFFFYLLYHPMAWTYDWVAAVVSLGSWQKWVYSIIPYIRGARILELGYGPGHLQKALWKNGTLKSLVCGIDVSSQMARIARRSLRRAGISPDLINGYAQNLPFPANTFQTVAATFPAEYIFHPSTLAEVYRILEPGGRFVVLTSAIITGSRRLEKTAAWLFKVTRQSSLWEGRLLEPARQAGFQARVEEIQLNSSLLIYVIADKAEQNPTLSTTTPKDPGHWELPWKGLSIMEILMN